MEKKYLVLVISDPYGRDDGFQEHAAKGIVLNNKLYDNKDDAEKEAEILTKQMSHEEIYKGMYIPYDIFYKIRDFLLFNNVLNVNGVVLKNKYTKNEQIKTFLDMFELRVDYNYEKYEHDEELFQRTLYDEPLVKVIEVDA